MPQQLIFLELNEISFDSLALYFRQGRLRHLNAVVERHGWSETISEEKYDEIEPWIQWVTAHTGLALAQHGVFRLGDIVRKDIPQIWERLEGSGFRVGAVSPMNAKHRLRDPAFFVPDPWTPTEISAPPALKRLFAAIVQAVNDNAQSRFTASSIAALLAGFTRYARIPNYLRYATLALGSVQRPWRRALFLDLLLADVFVKAVRATKPDFATLFLNAGAHIQHHYMFSSEAYRGLLKNPDWYTPSGADPVLEAYELYDAIIGQIRRMFPGARLMIATGLHQVPHKEVTYYWRLKDHSAFLRRIGVDFARVEPRMSRDFIVFCQSHEQAAHAQASLSAVVAADGLPLFEVDNRGSDLFVMLTYPRDIDANFVFSIHDREYQGFRNDVAFVALKNGEHSGVGYFIDTGARKGSLPSQFQLSEVPKLIMEAMGCEHTRGATAKGAEQTLQSA